MTEPINRYEWEAELAQFAQSHNKLKFENLSTEQLDFIRQCIKLDIIPTHIMRLFNKQFGTKVPSTTFFDWYKIMKEEG